MIASAPIRADSKVDFQRDVAPLLQKHCWDCHGEGKRRGGLRLTNRIDGLVPGDTGRAALVPGKSEHSELIRRVLSAEPDLQMPPKGVRLSAAEVKILKTWIDEGLDWPVQSKATSHWAYRKIETPALPPVVAADWVKNPIDRFVLAKLEKVKVRPAPHAESAKLLRRLYLDLIGLPPTIAQRDAFLADARPDAYERVVEELLASPHYGERWARPWLDLARYADSNGFQRDGFRELWPYRDWVIRAFNADLPYNQFVRDQLAGDLLPGASLDQKIATGFNRCVPINLEAGVDREEVRVQGVIDRVNTMGTVFLGTTLACAQCHNHKYDPISQTEYYQLYAYFNNTPIETVEAKGTARELSGPKMTVPDPPGMQEKRAALEADRKKLAGAIDAALTAWEKRQSPSAKALPPSIRKTLDLAVSQRTVKQQAELLEWFAKSDAKMQDLREQTLALEQQIADMASTTTLVMEELPQPRPTHVMKRGNFLDKGPRVQPGTPAVFFPQSKGSPANRLGLAQWIASSENPLLARVAVNRWWADFFGQGIVGTLEDFGSQSAPPTHPELLDWLASDFIASGWSMKSIHRRIVTSATYRQSSNVSKELLSRDPENKLLARGPRLRLEAELIRDQALAVSGLLSPKLGGPPVFPPQPSGLWNVTGRVDNTYRTSVGEDRYRRGIYTIWRRSSPYPSFTAFDAQDRGACLVQRPRTNTPLQALTLLNDPVYVEIARAFARRVLTDKAGAGERERIEYAFGLCLTRAPSAQELAVLEKALEQDLQRYRTDPDGAKRLWDAPPPGVDLAAAAAWYHLAAVLLNLDETITK